MKSDNAKAVRDISYATAAQGRSGRTMIKVMENASGRLGLIRKAHGYDRDMAQGADFWTVMTERYGLTLEVVGGRSIVFRRRALLSLCPITHTAFLMA